MITKIPKESEIIVLADIIGGSPLSTAMNVLAQSGLIDKTTVLGLSLIHIFQLFLPSLLADC